MKFSFKVIITVLATATALNLSCKKIDSSVAPAKETINADISKQIALDLYHSLTGGVTKNDGLKTTAEHTGKTAITTSQECGMVFTSFTDSTAVKGDTTRVYSGKTIFTNMCNGYFNNGWNVDAYLLADTLKTTEKGAGFNNIYNVTLNYDVRALDVGYRQLGIKGTTTTSSYKSKVSGSAITESHKMETVYHLRNISALRNAFNPQYVDGRVDFSTKTTDTEAGNGATTTNAYSGYMEFYANNTMKAFFEEKNGTYKVFQLNLLTGEVKAL